MRFVGDAVIQNVGKNVLTPEGSTLKTDMCKCLAIMFFFFKLVLVIFEPPCIIVLLILIILNEMSQRRLFFDFVILEFLDRCSCPDCSREMGKRRREETGRCQVSVFSLYSTLTHYTICMEVTGRSLMDIVDEGTHVIPLSTSYCVPLHTPVVQVIKLEVHFAGREVVTICAGEYREVW
jgi:hypothetical protein